MNSQATLPVGVVLLDEGELEQFSGGGIWPLITGAAVFGFTAGRWIFCAMECLLGDA